MRLPLYFIAKPIFLYAIPSGRSRKAPPHCLMAQAMRANLLATATTRRASGQWGRPGRACCGHSGRPRLRRAQAAALDSVLPSWRFRPMPFSAAIILLRNQSDRGGSEGLAARGAGRGWLALDGERQSSLFATSEVSPTGRRGHLRCRSTLFASIPHFLCLTWPDWVSFARGQILFRGSLRRYRGNELWLELCIVRQLPSFGTGARIILMTRSCLPRTNDFDAKKMYTASSAF